MNFENFLKRAGALGVIDTKTLLAGVSEPAPLRVQISRWVRSRKLVQLRRGIYLAAEPYRRTAVSEWAVAGILERPSYISLQKALEHYDLIPEAVPVFTSVTTKRPLRLKTSIGLFDYRHIQNSLFWGYRAMAADRQMIFIATPEKALLDLFYLHGREISRDYLEGMRLQNLGSVNERLLIRSARRFGKPRMERAARLVAEIIRSDRRKGRRV